MVENLTINPPIDRSDHAVRYFSLDFSASCVEAPAYSYYRGSYQAMSDELDSMEWDKNMENKNVQEACNCFSSTICWLVE